MMMFHRLFELTLLASVLIAVTKGESHGQHGPMIPNLELDPQYWMNKAKMDIDNAMDMVENHNIAKNVILFVGDGLDITTITASRILKGQDMGNPGEETVLKFEEFPYVSLTKTYNLDRQTPDSAGTATAFLCGVKAKYGVIGLDGRAETGVCEGSNSYRLTSMLDWSIAANKWTGVVSTARITHATPAAAYAHVAQRNWENDAVLADNNITGGCKDIAAQLIDDNKDIHVVMGGGRVNFYPNTVNDVEYNLPYNQRRDNRTLPQEWMNAMDTLGRRHKYVWNKSQFDDVDPDITDYLLGLFEPSHMQYEVDRTDEPSLSEMVAKSIRILRRSNTGYFLFVESGRIDHAHHDNKAHRALRETLELENAIKMALDLVDTKETLIIMTSDHSHVFDISGYSYRGNPILGLVEPYDDEDSDPTDDKPMSVLLYSNGPGHFEPRRNLTGVDTTDKDFVTPSGVPLDSETHGGEDIATFAIGPMAHLFHKVHEQNYVAHVMAYSACIGPYAGDCKMEERQMKMQTCSASTSLISISLFLFTLLIALSNVRCN